MRSRQLTVLSLLLGLLLAATSGAAAESRTIILDDTIATPGWDLLRSDLSGMAVSLSVPSLSVRDVSLSGETFAEITVEGGELQGKTGQPALPSLARLVTVPEGMTLRVRDVRVVERILDGSYRPLPAQPITDQDSKEIAYDRTWYSDRSKALAEPRVLVGEPALMHGVRVVPLSVQPVTWDRTTGLATAASKIDVDFELIPSGDGLKSRAADRPMPDSFATLLAETVLGFDKSAVNTIPLGTWICISPDNAAVAAAIKPLVDWRKRQGYNVISVTTTDVGTSNTQIRTYLSNQYQGLKTPLEMVCLIGDADGSVAIPSWRESLSGYTGEGDHFYTQLDGGDILSDVHLGRLSATSTTELTTIVNKIVNYESDPWLTDDLDWYKRAGLTGDPGTSGYSTIWVNQWVKEQLLEMSYTQIDTIWSGNFLSQMLTTINAGESLFTYRGYWNMSGMHTGYISTFSNQEKLSYSVILTCDTGSFWSDPTCRSEGFLRAPNGGAVASIGTATTGTHTRYNNCVFLGILQHVLGSGDPRVGPSLTAGKLNMYRNYNANEAAEVEIWSTWNNLMGDPATAMWSAQPQVLTIDAPANVTNLATALPVSVTAAGSPVAGAVVAAYNESGISVHAITGDDGTVVLPLAGLVNGELLLTVTGTNLKPYLGGVNVGPLAVSLNPAAPVLDDDNSGSSTGDGDGLAEPGETVEIQVALDNHGTSGASDVTAVLVSPIPEAVVVQGSASYGYINSGAQASGDAAYALQLDPSLPGGTVVPLEIVATSGSEDFTGLVELTVTGPAASLASTQVDGGAGLNPGETGTVRVTVINDGNALSNGATLTLTSTDHWVSVVDGDGTLPAILTSGSATNAADLFTISVAGDCVPGHLAILNMDLVFDEGGTASLEVPITFGSAVSTDPSSAETYDYYAFDNTDTAYDAAPTYNWVEIDPDLGGSGTSLGLTDFAKYDDDTKVVDLPFTFRYFGKDFTKLSICSNGWMSMGSTYQRHYRNWALPAPGSPDNLIAVFWDELYMPSSNGGVFTWYDAANHRFIVEWRRLLNHESGAIETFQAILFDPDFGAGDTGDGEILMQYETIAQVDPQNGYSTVGIQNGDRTDALLYTYWNAYTPGSAPLAAGRAILYTTVQAQIQGSLEGHVSNTTAGGAPVDGATISVLGSARNLVSASNGDYLGGVPIGTYDLAISHPSFAPDTTYGVVISEGLTTLVDFALVDVAGPLFSDTIVPEATTDTVGPYSVTTMITDESGILAAQAFYTSSASGGPFELPLTATGTPDEFEILIPGQPQGTRLQFWFTGMDVADNPSVSPLGGPFAPHSFVVTNATTIYASDMETLDGWTSGATGDDASSGIWERVDPNGVTQTELVQPEDDHSVPGTMCWITGNDPVGSTQGTDDVDSGTTTLLSPVIDLTDASGLELRYWRWYTNDTGFSPNEDDWVVDVSFDGGPWLSLENTTASQRSWTEKVFLLETIAPELGSQLQLRFVAEDLGGGSVVEAGVDDVTLTGFSLPVDAAAPTVALTQPNGGETISVGSDYDIQWTHADDIGVVEARVWLSLDAGSNWELLASGAHNQIFQWAVPNNQGTECRLKVEVLDAVGNLTSVESATNFTINGGTPVNDVPRHELSLLQNKPNPFNPQTDIQFSLPARGEVSLRVYNVEGKLVRTLVTGTMLAGPHTVTWKGDDNRGGRVASGLYFYRLQTPAGERVRKMTLLK